MGGEYLLKTAVDKAEEMLVCVSKSNDMAPPAQFFETIQAINSLVHELQQHFQTIVLPVIQNHPTKLTVCTERQRSVIVPLEKNIKNGLQLSLDALVRYMGHLL